MKFFAIGEDVFAGVPVGEAEVEDFFIVKLGNAAVSSAEAVDEPAELGERFELEDFEIADGFEMPGGGDFWRGGGTRERTAGFAARL